MDLSVVVLSWNTAALTVRALRAAVAGAGDLTAEVICVDNASGDDTAERVHRECPGVRLILNETNLGFAAGNNRALPYVSGRYTCFLNSDAEPAPGALAHIVHWLDRHPDVGIAAPALVGSDGAPQRAARPEPTPLGLLHRTTPLAFTPVGRRAARTWSRPPSATQATDVDSVMGACLVARTELLRRLGGFDEGYFFYWEDVDLCRRARTAGARVVWVPEGPPVVHAGGVATAIAGAPRLAFVAGMIRYQRSVLSPASGGAFAACAVLGVVTRALLDAPRLGLRSLIYRVRGRPKAARRAAAAARGWLTFLERNGRQLVRLLAPPR